jgi:oligopeptide transport system substrate-binding protein
MGGYEPTVLLTGGPVEARRLLAEAGYPGGAGFPRVTYEYNTLDRNRTVAEILQQMWWKELGIHVELMNEEWKVYLDSLHSGRFSLIRSGWAPFVNDPVDYYELFVTNAPNNDTGWGDRRFDALYDQALQTQDATSRYALYREMDTIIRDEAPVAPLVFNCSIRLVDPRVRHWPNNVLDARELSAVTLDAGAAP